MARGRTKEKRSAEPDLIRFGVSIPEELLKKFDRYLTQRNNLNRSEAIRDLIRDRMIQADWSEGKGEQIATVTLVYDNRNSDTLRRLAEAKRNAGAYLLSTMHVRLSQHEELEVIALRGPAGTIRAEAESLTGIKGLSHGKMVMTIGPEDVKKS